MAIITTNQPTAGLAGFSQNRKPLTVDNRSDEYQYVGRPDQLQNSQSLFPDANIPLSKLDARFPTQYDAIATKDHVLGTTLIEYNGVVFYRIADVFSYAIDLGLTSFAIFLHSGTYQESSDIGNYQISVSITGSDRQSCIIDFGVSEGRIRVANNSYLQNIQVITARLTSTPVVESGISNSPPLQDASGSVFLNCNFEFTATGASFDKQVVKIDGGNLLIQSCSFIHPGEGTNLRLLGLSSDSSKGFVTISNCIFIALNSSTGVSIAVYIAATIRTISGMNLTANRILVRGVIVAGIVFAPTTPTPIIGRTGINVIENNDIELTSFGGDGFGISIQVQFGQSSTTVQTVNYIVGNRIRQIALPPQFTGIEVSSGINKIVDNSIIGGVVGIKSSSINIQTLVHGNDIQTQELGAIFFSGSNYIFTNNIVVHPLNGCAADFQGTATGAIIANNKTETNIPSGGAGGRAYRGTTFTGCIFEGNSHRSSNSTGLLIEVSVAANTNIITSNRNRQGGATFLNFPVGTNIVANNLST